MGAEYFTLRRSDIRGSKNWLDSVSTISERVNLCAMAFSSMTNEDSFIFYLDK